MAFTGSFVCSTFKRQLFEGVHNFLLTGGDAFKLALYTDAATLTAATTAYTATGEVSASGTGYTTTGYALTRVDPTLSGSTVIIDFSNTITISNATLTARGSLTYNSTEANAAVCVNDFGTDKTASGGDFVINFPTPDASNAFLRLT